MVVAPFAGPNGTVSLDECDNNHTVGTFVVQMKRKDPVTGHEVFVKPSAATNSVPFMYDEETGNVTAYGIRNWEDKIAGWSADRGMILESRGKPIPADRLRGEEIITYRKYKMPGRGKTLLRVNERAVPDFVQTSARVQERMVTEVTMLRGFLARNYAGHRGNNRLVPERQLHSEVGTAQLDRETKAFTPFESDDYDFEKANRTGFWVARRLSTGN